MSPGQIRYALVTNDQGGILDDVLVYHLADAAETPYYQMVVNASNRAEDLGHLARSHRRRRPTSISSIGRTKPP